MTHLIRVAGVLVLVLAVAAAGRAEDSKKKDADEGKKGTVTGVVTAKADNSTWIEVKADGEEKPRRYMPNWKGGQPKDGGGPDKEVVARIKETPLKARVQAPGSAFSRTFRVSRSIASASDHLA